MKEYKIYLDEFVEKLFYEMEKVQDGKCGHECIIYADTKIDAATELILRLTPFFEKHFEEVK